MIEDENLLFLETFYDSMKSGLKKEYKASCNNIGQTSGKKETAFEGEKIEHVEVL